MSKRYDALGIKQVIRLEWLQKTVNLLLAGFDKNTIRQELHSFLANTKGSGTEGTRGNTSRSQAVNILMNIWVTPDNDLVSFRDKSLTLLKDYPSISMPVHWGIISAAYPFWFNIAKQIGRLFNLQKQITQRQVFSRLKEMYGDRESVARYARYTTRSFVAWGVLVDSKSKGCYEKCKSMEISDPNLTILLYEAALYADKEGKAALGLLKNNPAFFPFQLPVLTGDYISQQSDAIEVVRYGLDDELLKLTDK